MLSPLLRFTLTVFAGAALGGLHLELLRVGSKAHLGLGEVNGEHGDGLAEELEGNRGHSQRFSESEQL